MNFFHFKIMDEMTWKSPFIFIIIMEEKIQNNLSGAASAASIGINASIYFCPLPKTEQAEVSISCRLIHDLTALMMY